VGLVFTMLCSFITTGYQALLPVLLDQGVYSWLCPSHNAHTAGGDSSDCVPQANRLDLMFTVSMGMLSFSVSSDDSDGLLAAEQFCVACSQLCKAATPRPPTR